MPVLAAYRLSVRIACINVFVRHTGKYAHIYDYCRKRTRCRNNHDVFRKIRQRYGAFSAAGFRFNAAVYDYNAACDRLDAAYSVINFEKNVCYGKI